MAKKVNPTISALIYDALLKCFWRKEALKRYLRDSGISANYISQLDMSEQKRVWLDRLFPLLADQEKGPDLLLSMGENLAAMTAFPDLMIWEDRDAKVQAAQEAVAALAKALGAEKKKAEQQRQEQDVRTQASQMRQVAIRHREDREKLKARMTKLTPAIGTQKGGYDFEEWFYDFLDYEEIENRRPYKIEGRQIDGSLTVDGTTYLVELKFEATQAGATDTDSLKAKIGSKADNTMGVMVAVSGYSSVAISEASGPKSAILLFDAMHIMMALEDVGSFKDSIRRVRRHISQTGQAYLSAHEFGG
jgi:hypothetical protein